MANFNYEWWTVDIIFENGTYTCEFKGRNKSTVIKQIQKMVEENNSEKNQMRDVWHRQPKVIAVNWESLKLDRIGYQRMS